MPKQYGPSSRAKLILAAAATLIACVLMPALASAQPATAGTWALDFSLSTFGKAGCLTCHSDPNLMSAVSTGPVSFYIDPKVFNASAHAGIACTGCHLNFNFKPPHTAGDWKATAKQACVNCHKPEFLAYTQGIHAPKPVLFGKADPKAAQKPLCGDCHGFQNIHGIQKLKNNPAAQAALHTQSQAMCGRVGCHKDRWDSYNDYYHGAAYKTGAPDAPACWDCHGTHTMLRTVDPASLVNPGNLKQSCGKCHEGAGPAMQNYAPEIHGRAKIAAENPLRKILASFLPFLR